MTDQTDDTTDPAASEDREWLDSLQYVLDRQGPGRAAALLAMLNQHAYRSGVDLPFVAATPYVNTITPEDQPPYPGDLEIERRIESYVRWNAMAMVVHANRQTSGIGGHISTFGSSATLYEVGFNHFWRARHEKFPGDTIYFQGHASPGIYARAYLEGRLDDRRIANFRRELADGGGLASYPHPWLMPDFWEFPTVSMGLGPLMAIYQAHFEKYLVNRGLFRKTDSKVWAMAGDGEMDEPESLGGIHLAGREQLDNLIFVVNCNLQRLDGPVRGNGSIVRELEGVFRGAGWRVIKVLWGSDWDPLLASPAGGRLVRRFNEVCDGDWQKYVVAGGRYMREHFFGADEQLRKLVERMPDESLERLRRGGHDPVKVYAAYHAAVRTEDRPTVILAQTIKGYGQGEAGEGRNISHQQKKLNEAELKQFRTRFSIPIDDDRVNELPLYRPAPHGAEMQYLRERRVCLWGYMPHRKDRSEPIQTPPLSDLSELTEGSEKPVSTTMATVRLLSRLLKDERIGKLIVPIVPDEARTFGMESLFRQCGIYNPLGQRYEPVDADMMLYYREATDGQILEEGITEAGCMCSFLAAGTAHVTRGLPCIPIFLFYSMFGFQRIGDLIWAAGDARAKGILVGGTSGRTTLNGEGLQHQDGHSLLLASAYPTVRAYDPAFAYEVAVIVQSAIEKLYVQGETAIYYLTVANENHPMPAMPKGKAVIEGILRGLYRYRQRKVKPKGRGKKAAPHVNILGSGSILFEALAAQDRLAEEFAVASTVWSATSYGELARDALAVERWNQLHPGRKPKQSYLAKTLARQSGPFLAVSDYVRAVPNQIAPWVPGGLTVLGTDGFGRSESREALRRFFEIDAAHVVYAGLRRLADAGDYDADKLPAAIRQLNIDPDLPPPWTV